MSNKIAVVYIGLKEKNATLLPVVAWSSRAINRLKLKVLLLINCWISQQYLFDTMNWKVRSVCNKPQSKNMQN